MAGKKVVILLGSPRKDGNTAALAERIAEGAAGAGADVETVCLADLDIAPCTGCEGCHKPGADGCVIKDDMQDLYPKLAGAASIVYASPVYWFTVSAQLKAAMDRCYGLVGPDGQTHGLAGKRIGLAFTYGADDAVESGCINAIRMFQDIFGFVGSEIVGMVHGSTGAGKIADNAAVMEKAADLGRQLVAE